MRRAIGTTGALLAALLGAGCGGAGQTVTVTVGAGSTAPTTGAATSEAASTATTPADPSTATTATLPAPTAPTRTAEPPFPARSGADVVALATQGATGTARYDVSSRDGSGVLDVASDGRRAALHLATDRGETWVGLDVGAARIAWVCALDGGQRQCRRNDADRVGARAAGAVARLLGRTAVQATFGPAAAGSDAHVGIDTQAGQQVSCLATVRVRLCATKAGTITWLVTGTTSVKARTVTTDVAASALDPPDEPR